MESYCQKSRYEESCPVLAAMEEGGSIEISSIVVYLSLVVAGFCLGIMSNAKRKKLKCFGSIV